MNSLNTNLFQVFCELSQKAQRVQKNIEENPVDPKTRIALHKELEHLQYSVEKVGTTAELTHQAILVQFQDLDEQIVSMYRQIEDRFEAYEIDLISNEALQLSSSLDKNQAQVTARKIDQLRHNIHFLFQHRKPSLKNRKIITLVIKLSDQVGEALLKKGETSKEHLQLIQLLSSLLREALSSAESFLLPEEGELAMELYEIADLFHHQKENEALVKLKLIRSKLNPGEQRRLDQAEMGSKEMVQILLEIARGDRCIAYRSGLEEIFSA